MNLMQLNITILQPNITNLVWQLRVLTLSRTYAGDSSLCHEEVIRKISKWQVQQLCAFARSL